jgi:hypothetical protein
MEICSAALKILDANKSCRHLLGYLSSTKLKYSTLTNDLPNTCDGHLSLLLTMIHSMAKSFLSY